MQALDGAAAGSQVPASPPPQDQPMEQQQQQVQPNVVLAAIALVLCAYAFILTKQ